MRSKATPGVSRRNFIVGTVGATLLGGLAACSETGTGNVPGGGAGKGETLNFWTYYELAGRSSTFPGMIEQYESRNDGVKIELNAALENYNTVLRTAMLGGEAPDVIGVPQYLMRDFAEAGLLKGLEEFRDRQGLNDAMYPAALAAGEVDGMLYGIADALRFGMWFYNPETLDKLDESEPETYDDLVRVSGKLRKQSITPIIFGLQNVNVASNSFQSIGPSFVGLSEILEASENQDYTDQRFVDALGFYKQMVDDGILDERDAGIDGEDAKAMLATGRASMLPSASYDIGTLVALNENISAFTEPVRLVAEPRVKYWGGAGQMYCLPKDSRHPQEAEEFLGWWLEADQVRNQVRESDLVASIESANEGIEGDLAQFAASNLDKVEDEGLFYNNYIPSDEAEAWGRAIQEVVSGSKTAKQAIETTIQAVF